MPDQTIKCPKCKAEIPLTEALTSQIEQVIRAQYEAEANKKEQELAQRSTELKEQEKALKSQRQALDDEVEKRLGAERKKIVEQIKELEAERQAIDEQVAEQLKAERKKIAEQEKTKILSEQAEQTKALQEELEEKRKQLSQAKKKELELRKQQQKLEEEKETIELTVQRTLDEERKKIAEQASKKAEEEQQLKMREKNDKIDALMQQINELKRKAEVGSQEAQGEALEGALQDGLQQAFPLDIFDEIKKGVKGADILQKVRNSAGKTCGTILWESKNTKDFSNKWIDKLKVDQQTVNADFAVIMSVVLPKEIENFGPYEDIWVTDYKSAIGLCALFRETLLRIARQKLVVKHQEGMKDFIYEYITGQEFILSIKAVVNAYKQMQEDLESEKRSMTRIWKRREKQISTVLANVTGIYGSIEGLVRGQKALPAIETLSLEAVAPEEPEDEEEF